MAAGVLTGRYAALDDSHVAEVFQSSFLEARALPGTQPAAGVDFRGEVMNKPVGVKMSGPERDEDEPAERVRV